MVKGVIFDLDGTLIDTIEGLANSVNAAMDFYNFPKHSIEKYRSLVGNGVGKLVERALPEDKKHLKDEARKIFEKHYTETMLNILPVYDGIEELLAYLIKNNIKIAVNTNKMDVFAKPMIKKVFGDMFFEVLGEVSHFERKPSPDGVNYLLEKMGIDRTECLYVGDSQVDIKTARNAQMRCVSVTWGFATMDVLLANEPEILVSDPREIIDLIERENYNAG
ncbi:MAG: HAD-IA family hydrolase [Clostridia bacterium]|nr:HAD-IA family hydrolase [Clostridia bacterium]